MTHDITVACVLRYGGVYDARYVFRLKGAVDRYLPGARFVCLSDTYFGARSGIETVHLEYGWPGWWSKQELFRPGILDDCGLVLYLDLDTVLVGDLSGLTEYKGERAVLRDLYRPDSMIGSGIMLWRGGAMREVWDAFSKDPEKIIEQHPARSDYFMEPMLRDADRIQDLFPGWVVSYKRDVKTAGSIPEGTRIVCLHGRPRLHQLYESDPVAIAWKGNGV